MFGGDYRILRFFLYPDSQNPVDPNGTLARCLKMITIDGGEAATFALQSCRMGQVFTYP